MTPWSPPKALPVTCYRHNSAHNIGPPGSRCLPVCALEICQVVPWKVYLMPWELCLGHALKSVPGALEMSTWSAGGSAQHQTRLFRAQPGRFSGQKVANFWTQGAQYYEHLMPEPGQLEGHGRQPRCCWTCLTKAHLPSENIFMEEAL